MRRRSHPVSLRLATIGGGIVVALLGLELVLQLGALWVWRQAARSTDVPPVDPDGARVVLCVGDSFTFGVGAGDRANSYPRLLADRLVAHDDRWRVVNRGWPGRNTKELVAYLPSQLRDDRPAAVCVLVGTNDRWNFARNVPDDAPTGWTWRWRTGRLAAIAWYNLRSRAARAPPSRPTALAREASALSHDDLERTLETLRDDAADPGQRMRVIRDLDATRSRVRASDDPEIAELYLAAMQAVSMPLFEEAEFTLERFGPRPAPHRIMVRPLLRANRLDDARRAAITAVELGPHDALNHRALARVRRDEGRPRDAAVSLVRAFACDGDGASLAHSISRWQLRESLTEIDFRGVIEEVDLASRERDAVLAIWRSPDVVTTNVVGVREDLPRIVEAIRDAGAVPLVLTYPSDGTKAEVNGAIRDVVAGLAGVQLVDLEPVFDDALATMPKSDLFVADGHCNARGYALVAEVVVARILELETTP